MITAANTPHTITNALMICFSSETDIGTNTSDIAARCATSTGFSLGWLRRYDTPTDEFILCR